MKRALFTLVLGDRYRQRFAAKAAPTFRAYARAHGLSLVVLDRLIDPGPLGLSRSPAWQKCLIMRHPKAAACDQVAWIDADIVIRPDAPDIFEGVPPDAFGAVDAFASPSPEAYAAAAGKIRAYMAGHGLAGPDDATPEGFYRHYGFETGPDRVAQTGVLVLTPEVHGPILEAAYAETRRPDSRDMLFEMRPLSHHLLTRSPVVWLDPRFNTLWATALFNHYPFLADPAFRAGFRDRPDLYHGLKARCLAAAYETAYFLHFAGAADDMDAMAIGQGDTGGQRALPFGTPLP
jgi:hypothetical protein